MCTCLCLCFSLPVQRLLLRQSICLSLLLDLPASVPFFSHGSGLCVSCNLLLFFSSTMTALPYRSFWRWKSSTKTPISATHKSASRYINSYNYFYLRMCKFARICISIRTELSMDVSSSCLPHSYAFPAKERHPINPHLLSYHADRVNTLIHECIQVQQI